MQPSAPTKPPRRVALTLALAVPTLMAIAGAGLIVTCATAAPAPAAAEPAADAAAVAAALARFQQATAGQKDAIEPAAEQLLALSSRHPQDPVLRAYAGAATSMRATTTMLPWRKMAYADDGLGLIDKALAQLTPQHDQALHRGVPALLETRFVAATSFLALPAMFNRGERGRSLLQQVLGSPLLDPAPLPFRAAVWMRAARLAEADKQPAEARKWYQLAADSGTPVADAARERLKSL
ncbi:hypothetical protein [Pseudorhodoferax sp.]|uniref:hypothetical protein n=1 Tax=Pseudorhodoferax sp. TaxID=1993553 RepID=UPI002DD67506|nr:hypothetical protein [Pseudorhodoferax sp.]